MGIGNQFYGKMVAKNFETSNRIRSQEKPTLSPPDARQLAIPVVQLQPRSLQIVSATDAQDDASLLGECQTSALSDLVPRDPRKLAYMLVSHPARIRHASQLALICCFTFQCPSCVRHVSMLTDLHSSRSAPAPAKEEEK